MRIRHFLAIAFFALPTISCGRITRQNILDKSGYTSTLQNENFVRVEPIKLNSKNIAEAMIDTKKENVRILIYPEDKSSFTEYSMSFKEATKVAEKYNVEIWIDGEKYTNPEKIWGKVELKGGSSINIFDRNFLIVAKKFEVIEGFIEWLIREYILSIDKKLKEMKDIFVREAKDLKELGKKEFASTLLPSVE